MHVAAVLMMIALACATNSAVIAIAPGTEARFQVVRMWPRTPDQLALITDLYRAAAILDLDFWKAPTSVGAFVDTMATTDVMQLLTKKLDAADLEYKIIVDDVQKQIVEKESPPPRLSDAAAANPLLTSFFASRLKDVSTSRSRVPLALGEYHSYPEIRAWLAEIEAAYPRLARRFVIGTTHEGRPIEGIKLGNPVESSSKRAVWIDGGIHAREWAAIQTALYFIDQLIGEYGYDPVITGYLDTLSIYVLPVANPDGFEYSRSDVSPAIRFWRKNRGGIKCVKDRWHRDRCCGGVDLNRNFDFHFGETGSSLDPCSDIYQGASAFSEPESRAIRDKLQSPELWGRVDAFITLHTYSQMWIHPFNHERRSFPADIQDLQSVGQRGVAAIESLYGTKYRFGTGADILYPSSGGSDDWAKAKANVKYVYLLELRPGEEKWDGFLLDRRQLIPTGRETWEGIKVVISAVVARARAMQPAPAPVQVSRQAAAQASRPAPRPAPPSPLAQQRPRPALAQSPPLSPAQVFRRTFRPAPQSSPPTVCQDRSRWCTSWKQASPNICQRSSVYMKRECVLTCGFCSG